MHCPIRTILRSFILYGLFAGATKPEIGWDLMGSDGTRSRVLAFGTFGSRVPGFDVIVITDLIYFSPLAINNISKNGERNSIGICLQNHFLVPVTESNVL